MFDITQMIRARRMHSNILSNQHIKKMLEADMPGFTFSWVWFCFLLILLLTNVDSSTSTIKNRRKDLGLLGSRYRSPDPMTETEKLQLVLQQMDQDPTGEAGKGTLHAWVALHYGFHLTCQFVGNIMHIAEQEEHVPCPRKSC